MDTSRQTDDVPAKAPRPVPTGCAEFDDLMSGGLEPGGITLITAPPGSGRSSLLHLVASHAQIRQGEVLLYASDEAPRGLDKYAARLGLLTPLQALPTDAWMDDLMRRSPRFCLVDASQSFMARVVVPAMESHAGALRRRLRETGTCLLIATPDRGLARRAEFSADALAIIVRRSHETDRSVLLRVLKNHHGPQREGLIGLE